MNADFSPKDDNLGELMSTVCSVHVGRWAGVGACSAEVVGGPAGSAGGRLRVRDSSGFVSPPFLYPPSTSGRGF